MANKPKQSSKKQLKNTKNKKKLTVIFLVDAWFPFIGGGQVYARELKHSLEIFFNCTVRLYYPPRPHILVRAFWSLYVPFQILIDSLTSKVNVIHSQGYNSGLAGMLSAWLIKVPIVHTVHGSNLLDLGSSSIKTLMERILLTRLPYNAQISVTRSFLKYKNNAKKVIYIPNGVDVQAFDEVQTKKSSSPRVLWVGRDDFVKGYDVFCDAVKIIRK